MKIPAVGVVSVTSCTSSRSHCVSFVTWKKMLKRSDVGRRWKGRSVGEGMRVEGMVEVVKIDIEAEVGAEEREKAVVADEEVEVVGGVVLRGVGVGRVRGRRASKRLLEGSARDENMRSFAFELNS